MLNITLQQMRYALEVSRAGSISQAAKNLYLNQPNLSKSIKDLENELGISLFIRTPKGILISKEGSLFLKYAEAIFQKMEEMETALTSHRQSSHSFNISIPRASYITYAFTRFVNLYPPASRISINYRETNNEEAIENLLSHNFDLGIIRYTQPYPHALQELKNRSDLNCRKLWEEEYVLLLSKHHPLAANSRICLADLSDYTELIHGDETPVQTQKSMQETAKQISLYERGSQFDFLRNVPTTYMWVSPVPEEILIQNELVQKKCMDSHVSFCDLLITKSGYPFPPFSQNFLHTLKQICAELTSLL